MTAERNKETARRALEAFMTGDIDALRDRLPPEAVLHQCGFPEPIPAQSILARQFPRWRMVEDRVIRVEHVIADGNLVALHWRSEGQAAVDDDDPDAPRVPVSFPSMTFIRFEDGKIAEIWNIQDVATLQMQLS